MRKTLALRMLFSRYLLQSNFTDYQAPYLQFSWRFALQESKPRKPLWFEFWECVHRTEGVPKVQCKHCNKLFAHPRRNKQGTTTSMSDHLKICAAYQLHEAQTRNETGDIRSLFTNTRPGSFDKAHHKITQELVDERILKFFVSGNIPFQQADNEHFRALVSLIKVNDQPAQSPSRTTLRARLSKYSKLAVDDLKKVLAANDSKISLALDCWSSRSNYGFMGMYIL